MTAFRRVRNTLAALVVVSVGGLAAYWKFSGASAPAAPPMPPPPEVGVITTVAQEIGLPLKYAGRVEGFRVVEVRAQVGGILLKREFNEGDIVKAGDVLFRIDPRPYEAALSRANAQVAQAQATLVQTTENFGRVSELAERRVSPQKALDDAIAARDQAQASLQAAKADVETSKLNLEYTVIKAPITGPTSLTSPPEGALVLAQQTLLSTITQLDPAYVSFTTTESEFRALQEMYRLSGKAFDPNSITLQVQFGDGTTYPFPGRLDTRARTIDVRTGTIQIRSIFPNKDGNLLPGQFVRVNVEGVTMPGAILVPKQAISQGPQGAFVYVVNDEGIASIRPIRLDHEVPSGWTVRDGLKAGEKVVADGIIRVRPNQPVRAVPYVPQTSPAASPAPGAKP